MRYVSTRGEAPALGFSDAVLTGLARDGGLYVPEEWPNFSEAEIRAMRGLSYPDLAVRVLTPFLGGEIAAPVFERLVREAYATFRHPAVCPLVQTGSDRYVLELFHGPTLAFKDVAMQLLARLMDHVLAERDARATIVGATSGDTGGAAVEAFAGRERADVFILFPHNRVSPVQQRQMTTSGAKNIHAIAVEGNFDDCQGILKDLFNNHGFPRPRRPVGRQFDQLGARHGPDRLLFFLRALARRAGPTGLLRRADREFRRYFRGLRGQADGIADRRVW